MIDDRAYECYGWDEEMEGIRLRGISRKKGSKRYEREKEGSLEEKDKEVGKECWWHFQDRQKYMVIRTHGGDIQNHSLSAGYSTALTLSFTWQLWPERVSLWKIPTPEEREALSDEESIWEYHDIGTSVKIETSLL